MNKLRRLWYLLDTNNIHIRPRYIRSAANAWANKLSRHLDCDEWQQNPSMFHEMDTQFGPHTIDRFASALDTLLPRYKAKWLDPSCEAVTPFTSPIHPFGKSLLELINKICITKCVSLSNGVAPLSCQY
jgi:hypothetical protein